MGTNLSPHKNIHGGFSAGCWGRELCGAGQMYSGKRRPIWGRPNEWSLTHGHPKSTLHVVNERIVKRLDTSMTNSQIPYRRRLVKQTKSLTTNPRCGLTQDILLLLLTYPMYEASSSGPVGVRLRSMVSVCCSWYRLLSGDLSSWNKSLSRPPKDRNKWKFDDRH